MNIAKHRMQLGGWLAALWFVLLFAVIWGAQMAWGVGVTVGGRGLGVPEAARSVISRVGTILIVAALATAAARIIAHRRLLWESFPLHTGRPAAGAGLPRPLVNAGWLVTGPLGFFVGAAFSALGMAALFLIYTDSGWLSVVGAANPSSLALAALMAVLVNLQVALTEELLFRGYLLGTLTHHWKPFPALLFSSVLFAAPHLLVADASGVPIWLFVPALTLPGLMLGWAYLRTRTLWLPVGLHFGWNFAQSEIFNLVGDASPEKLLGVRTTLEGPTWLTGTAYGIEVGVMVVVPLAVCAAGIWISSQWGREPSRKKTRAR